MVTQALCWNQASPDFHREPAALGVPRVGAPRTFPVLSLSSGCVRVSIPSTISVLTATRLCLCNPGHMAAPALAAPLMVPNGMVEPTFPSPGWDHPPLFRWACVPVGNED